MPPRGIRTPSVRRSRSPSIPIASTCLTKKLGGHCAKPCLRGEFTRNSGVGSAGKVLNHSNHCQEEDRNENQDGYQGGCSGADSVSRRCRRAVAQTAEQKKLAGTEIRFLQPSMPQFAALGKFIPEFEKKYGITVKVDEVPFDQYRQKSLVEMQQGTGTYDFYAVDVMWLAEYAAAGFLDPLMPWVKNPQYTEEGYDIDDFLPRVISGTASTTTRSIRSRWAQARLEPPSDPTLPKRRASSCRNGSRRTSVPSTCSTQPRRCTIRKQA